MTKQDVIGYIINVYSGGYLGSEMFDSLPDNNDVRAAEIENYSNDSEKTLISKVNRTKGTYFYTTKYWGDKDKIY